MPVGEFWAPGKVWDFGFQTAVLGKGWGVWVGGVGRMEGIWMGGGWVHLTLWWGVGAGALVGGSLWPPGWGYLESLGVEVQLRGSGSEGVEVTLPWVQRDISLDWQPAICTWSKKGTRQALRLSYV